jgi:hypothetical protein
MVCMCMWFVEGYCDPGGLSTMRFGADAQAWLETMRMVLGHRCTVLLSLVVDSGRLALLAMMKPVRHAETRWK